VTADPRYVEARRVLLDALVALQAHGAAVVVAGAQAVYIRTGSSDLGIAPYTTDGDLALDPSLLGDDPALEDAMRGAGFRLQEPLPNQTEPGIWIAEVTVSGEVVAIPVDLLVPEGVAPPGGRRGARLPVHGARAARRVSGLEAALVDNEPKVIGALAEDDHRAVEAKVAGVAALFVAKLHKIHDRLAEPARRRADDKDAADVYRLMQTSAPAAIADTMLMLRAHPIAGPSTDAALDHLAALFGRPSGLGVEAATRALRLAIPEAQVRAVSVAYVERLLSLSR
jgi:hypothetical protein